MGSLFELIDAEEAEAQARVEELELQAAELAERLAVERERLSRLVITVRRPVSSWRGCRPAFWTGPGVSRRRRWRRRRSRVRNVGWWGF